MPLYDYRCINGHKFESYSSYEARDTVILCRHCSTSAARIPTMPMLAVSPVDYSYDCPITGRHITSKHAHEENLKAHDCRVLETGERDYNARIRAEADAALESKIDVTVEKSIDAMPSDKREKLYNEMRSSDISVERA